MPRPSKTLQSSSWIVSWNLLVRETDDYFIEFCTSLEQIASMADSCIKSRHQHLTLWAHNCRSDEWSIVFSTWVVTTRSWVVSCLWVCLPPTVHSFHRSKGLEIFATEQISQLQGRGALQRQIVSVGSSSFWLDYYTVNPRLLRSEITWFGIEASDQRMDRTLTHMAVGVVDNMSLDCDYFYSQYDFRDKWSL